MYDDYPKCPHRVDTNGIENSMRGKSNARNDVKNALRAFYDECIEKTERVLYVLKQLRAGLCGDDDSENES